MNHIRVFADESTPEPDGDDGPCVRLADIFGDAGHVYADAHRADAEDADAPAPCLTLTIDTGSGMATLDVGGGTQALFHVGQRQHVEHDGPEAAFYWTRELMRQAREAYHGRGKAGAA